MAILKMWRIKQPNLVNLTSLVILKNPLHLMILVNLVGPVNLVNLVNLAFLGYLVTFGVSTEL